MEWKEILQTALIWLGGMNIYAQTTVMVSLIPLWPYLFYNGSLAIALMPCAFTEDCMRMIGMI